MDTVPFFQSQIGILVLIFVTVLVLGLVFGISNLNQLKKLEDDNEVTNKEIVYPGNIFNGQYYFSPDPLVGNWVNLRNSEGEALEDFTLKFTFESSKEFDLQGASSPDATKLGSMYAGLFVVVSKTANDSDMTAIIDATGKSGPAGSTGFENTVNGPHWSQWNTGGTTPTYYAQAVYTLPQSVINTSQFTSVVWDGVATLSSSLVNQVPSLTVTTCAVNQEK